jgi:aarF domain-containing kinase
MWNPTRRLLFPVQKRSNKIPGALLWSAAAIGKGFPKLEAQSTPVKPNQRSGIVLFSRSLQLGFLFTPSLILFPFWQLHRRFINPKSTWWIKLFVKTLHSAGPVYIKLGQWLSTRSDLVPPDICTHLATLQSECMPHSFEYSKARVEALLNSRKDLYYELQIEELLSGVGAMAQVHRATLINPHNPQSKQTVAVKVLHPSVEEKLGTDLAFISMVGGLLSRLLPGSSYLGIQEEVTSFVNMLQAQISLTTEAHNLQRFHLNFKDDKDNIRVDFPQPLYDLEDEHVLVETFHTGVPLQSLIELQGTPFNSGIAETGVKTIAVIKNFFGRLLKANANVAQLSENDFDRQSLSC